jgi:hypothetical protein
VFSTGPARPGRGHPGDEAAAALGESWAEDTETVVGGDEALSAGDADDGEPRPWPGETWNKVGDPSEGDGGVLQEPVESALSELSGLVDRVAAVGGGVGGALPAGDCVALLEGLARALYPRHREGFLPGGVRAAETVDDLAVGTRDPGQRLAPGAAWRRVPSWGALANAVARAGAGATGLVLWQQRSGPGHAFAVHHVAEAGPRWIELQAPVGRRVRAQEPARAAAGARAVVVDAGGQVVAWHDIDAVLPPEAESAVPALALSDPPASREYGAIGAELELPLLLVKVVNIDHIPPDMVPAWSDVLFSNRYVKGVVEQITPGGNMFVEIVSQPVAEITGDDGYVDRQGYFNSVRDLENVLGRPGEFSLDRLEDIGLTISAKGRHVVLAPQGNPWWLIAAQYTIGLPIGALYDLYRWARLNSPDALGQDLRDIDTGLSFAERVAHLLAVKSWSTVNADIPLVTGELFYPEDVHAVKGFAVSVFTHAMAALRMEAARSSAPWGQPPAVRNAKEFLPVASRHAASVTRRALSRDVRQFLGGNAGRLEELFTQFAAEFGPQSIEDALAVPVSDLGADLGRRPDPESTVGGYLADAFLNEARAPRVRPQDFGVHTSFGELDHGIDRRRSRPLALSEVRQMRRATSQADSEAQHAQVADTARALVQADEDRRDQAQALRRLGNPATVASLLARHPVVRDAEELFRGTDLLDFLPDDLLNGRRIGLDRTPVLDAIRELALADGQAPPPGGPVITDPGGRMAAEMRRVLVGLEAAGREILDALARYPSSSQHSDALVAWAAMTRVAPRLLAAVDPRAGREIPEETSLTRWHRASEVRGSFFNMPRSDDLKRVDASVAGLLKARQDPGRLARVLLEIRAWRLSKNDSTSSIRATAVANLERRVVYELGALSERPSTAGPAASAGADGGRSGPSGPPRPAGSSVWAFPADTSAVMDSGVSAAIRDALDAGDLGTALRLSRASQQRGDGWPTAGPAASAKLAQWVPSPRLLGAVEAYAGSVSAFVEAVTARLEAVSLGLEALGSGESHDRAESRQRTAGRVAEAGATLEDALTGLAEVMELPVSADDFTAAEIADGGVPAAVEAGADGADSPARAELLARAGGLLGPAAEAWGTSEAAEEMRGRQHEALERIADLLAGGDIEGAREMAQEIGPDFGFPGRGAGGGMLVLPGHNFTDTVWSYPELARPAVLAQLIRGFRERVLEQAESTLGQRSNRLSQEEKRRLLQEWPAIERKLQKIIAVAAGSRGSHPLVPSGNVGTHPDFGSKSNDVALSADRREVDLARYLLGWATANPARHQEKTLARSIQDSRNVNLLIASLLRRAAEKIDTVGRYYPDVLRELKSGRIRGETWEFAYTAYFHESNADLTGRGLAYLISDVWAPNNPDRLYGVARNPEFFSFRDKMMVLHDLAEYFSHKNHQTAGSKMAPPLSRQMVQVTTRVDARGFRAAAASADNARLFPELNGRKYVKLNEDDPWVMLARRNSIPIWNGPSGTTARMGAFASWLGATVPELSAMFWGMAAFWRLHYDHTMTTSHTVHEVLDIASNFGIPYSVTDPYATLAHATVRDAIATARTAAAELRSALTTVGGIDSLEEALAADVGGVLDLTAQLDAEPWTLGYRRFSPTTRADVDAVRRVTDLTNILQEARSEILSRQHATAARPHPIVRRVITEDAMAAGMRRVMSGEGPRLSRAGMERLRKAREGSWQQAGAPRSTRVRRAITQDAAIRAMQRSLSGKRLHLSRSARVRLRAAALTYAAAPETPGGKQAATGQGQAFSLEVSVPGRGTRLLRFKPEMMAKGVAAAKLERQIVTASLRLRAGTRPAKDVPIMLRVPAGHTSQMAVIVQAASRAASLLGRQVILRMEGWPLQLKLCP